MTGRLRCPMYTAYFGLNENPFSLTPNPRFLFMSQRHREALAHLLYGMGEKGGFVLLTGEVGTGKTTLCRSLLEQVPEGVEVALVLNPKQTALELVASLCDELKISYPADTDSLKVLIDLLNRHLLNVHADGRRTVLIIDEAQNLSVDVLEQIRLLTNLETTTSKLLQILLIGQPELHVMMARPELRQLGQRITARYHLSPLLQDETAAYVRHRLEVAGSRRRLFTNGSLRLVHRLSGGVPRLINTICDRALLGAYAKQVEQVNRRLVRKAASEVIGSVFVRNSFKRLAWAAALVICLLLWAGWEILLPPRMDQAPSGPPKARAPLNHSDRGSTHLKTLAIPSGKGTRVAPSGEAEDLMPDLQKAYASSALFEGLLTKSRQTDMATAFSALFRQWQTEIPSVPGMTPCQQAATAGLRCYRDRGNWTTLRHLNRPAVLELVDRHQQKHYVTVIRIEEEQITVTAGDQEATINQAQIEPLWFGEFTILWQPPNLGSAVIKEGDRGPDVLWLRAQLNRVAAIRDEALAKDASGAVPPSPVFDEDLKKQVMAFQRANLIKPDGIVGEQTLIQLNRKTAGNAIPLLCPGPMNGETHVVDP